MKFTLENYTQTLDEKYGNVDLDLGDAGEFSLVRLGRLEGKQKTQHENLTRRHLELLEEAEKATATGERTYVDVAKDLAATRIDIIANTAVAGAAKLKKWLDAQPTVGVDLIYNKLTNASEEGEG